VRKSSGQDAFKIFASWLPSAFRDPDTDTGPGKDAHRLGRKTFTEWIARNWNADLSAAVPIVGVLRGAGSGRAGPRGGGARPAGRVGQDLVWLQGGGGVVTGLLAPHALQQGRDVQLVGKQVVLQLVGLLLILNNSAVIARMGGGEGWRGGG